ncbi:MAG TPA: phosphatidate cytidylyltransferase [Hyphomonadaceae bacterium]|nr:phosphatidate cytidylyltransferase [Hyphomonadaceae bacterium]
MCYGRISNVNILRRPWANSPSARVDLAALADGGHRRFDRRELALRVASAIVLVPVGLGSVLAGGWALALILFALGVAMAFEWTRMTRAPTAVSLFWITILTTAAALALATLRHGEHAVAAIVLGSMAATFPTRNLWNGLERAFGAVLIAGALTAFAFVRARPEHGFDWAMGVLLAIWANDIAAYFGGGALGGPKLVPTISPAKTWAGLISGIAAGAFVVMVWSGVRGDSFGPPLLAAVIGAVIALIGQIGDVGESVIKRHYNVKDASGLIPGHGGFMDRLDALCAASIASALVLAILRLS